MKRIRLKQITLTNFKGIANLSIDFDGQETTIAGANGTGKTTVFDAFTWLLFGKDSEDKKDFCIKAYDTNGETIDRLPHEVHAILEVDDCKISLRKCMKERWVKKRGSLEESFDGHDTECFINDVPLKISEYNSRITDICPEQTFKMITNPLYFTSQKTDVQRQSLLHLAGDVPNSEILDCCKDIDLESVLRLLNGKSLNDLKKEIVAKKKAIKNEINSIPARIDERRSSCTDTYDWDKIKDSISALNENIESIKKSISDRSNAQKDIQQKREAIVMELNNTNTKISIREYTLKNEAYESYLQKQQEYSKQTKQRDLLTIDKRNYQNDKKNLLDEKSVLEKTLDSLRNDYKSISSETLSISDDDFICPTCGRPFDSDDVEAKRKSMEDNFNANKANRLMKNKKLGIETKQSIEAIDKKIEILDNEIYGIDVRLTSIDVSMKEAGEIKEPTCDFDNDKELISLNRKKDELHRKLDKEPAIDTCDDLLVKLNNLEQEKRNNEILLSRKNVIEQNQQRIQELEDTYKAKQDELAQLEKTEYDVAMYSKACVMAIEQRVNDMFRMVRFRLFDTQVNGTEIETCEAMVNGVPYSTLNQAMKLNAGLDIINTICEKEGISAPIFIDNRESVTQIVPPENSQIINLLVSPEHKQLTIL